PAAAAACSGVSKRYLRLTSAPSAMSRRTCSTLPLLDASYSDSACANDALAIVSNNPSSTVLNLPATLGSKIATASQISTKNNRKRRLQAVVILLGGVCFREVRNGSDR